MDPISSVGWVRVWEPDESSPASSSISAVFNQSFVAESKAIQKGQRLSAVLLAVEKCTDRDARTIIGHVHGISKVVMNWAQLAPWLRRSQAAARIPRSIRIRARTAQGRTGPRWGPLYPVAPATTREPSADMATDLPNLPRYPMPGLAGELTVDVSSHLPPRGPIGGQLVYPHHSIIRAIGKANDQPIAVRGHRHCSMGRTCLHFRFEHPLTNKVHLTPNLRPSSARVHLKDEQVVPGVPVYDGRHSFAVSGHGSRVKGLARARCKDRACPSSSATRCSTDAP